MGNLGRWAFLIGLLVAVVAGIISPQRWMFGLLAALGVVVGAVNVTGEEETPFLLAAVAFLVSTSALAGLPLIGAVATQVIARIATFVSAALIVVALRTLFRIAKD
jgi:hypothetical protein